MQMGVIFQEKIVEAPVTFDPKLVKKLEIMDFNCKFFNNSIVHDDQ